MQVGSVIAKFKSDLSSFKKGVTDAQSSIRSFSNKASTNLKTIRNSSLIVSGAIAGVTVASLKLGEVAGKYESIRDAFGSMTKDMGIGVEDFEEKVASASRGTLDRLTILQGGTRALSLMGKEAFSDFGNQFADMAALSKKAARATGQDVTYMFDSLITGMSRESKMILDNLGITVDLTKAKSDYAEELGKGVKDLSISESKTAVLNHTLEKLKNIYGDVAVSSGGFAGGMSALKTTVKNAQIEIGTKLLPVLNDLVREIKPLIDEYLPKLVEWLEKTVNWFRDLDPEMKKVILAFLALAPAIAAIGVVAIPVTAALTGLGAVIGLVTGPVGVLVLGILGWVAAWKLLGKYHETVNETIKNFCNSLGEKIVKLDETTGASQKLKDGIRFLGEQFGAFGMALSDTAEWLGKETGATNTLSEANEWLTETFDALGQGVKDTAEEIGRYIEKMAKATKENKTFKQISQRVEDTLRWLKETLGALGQGFGDTIEWVKSLSGWFGTLTDKIGGAIGKLGEWAGKKIDMAARGLGIGEYALGGIVPGPIGRPQLAVVHGGEEITPANKRGKSGVSQENHIGQVIIQEPMDIDTFMRRLSFDYRTRGDLG